MISRQTMATAGAAALKQVEGEYQMKKNLAILRGQALAELTNLFDPPVFRSARTGAWLLTWLGKW